MATRQGVGLARLLCQRGRRATGLLESSLDSQLPFAAVRWRGKHHSANHDFLQESPCAFLSSNSSEDSESEERNTRPALTVDPAWLRAAPFRLHPHHSASSLNLPYTVRWSPSTPELSVRWFSSKPGSDAAALGAEFQGAVAEVLKSEHGERLQKETSASEAAACDDAVNSLSEAQKKAKQKEAAKKDKTILQQAIATIVGIPAALRAVFSMSGADWVRTFKGWGTAIKETAQHYWVGTKLLWADVRVASRLLLKVANGKSLTRRERKQLTRTVADVFRLVPFAIFVIVPFMEFLLPVFLRFFPNMLPSTFQDKMKEEELMKKKLQARLQYARFLQETVGEMAREVKSTSTGEKKKTAEDLVAFMQKVRTGQHVSNDDIVNFAKLFNDELTLDNISRPRLVSMCKYMGLSPFGTDAYLRYTLRARLNWIKEDDKLIQREGVDSLTEKELRSACRQRGMLMVGNMTEDEMRMEIREWLDLSLNRSLPSSLLILSRIVTRNLDDAVVQSTLPLILVPPPDSSRASGQTETDTPKDADMRLLWSSRTAPSPPLPATAFSLPEQALPLPLPLPFPQASPFPGGASLAAPGFVHGAQFSSMSRPPNGDRSRNGAAVLWDARMARTALSMGSMASSRAPFLNGRSHGGAQFSHTDSKPQPLVSQASVKTAPAARGVAGREPQPPVQVTALVSSRTPTAQEIISRVLRQLSDQKTASDESLRSRALVPYANRPLPVSALLASLRNRQHKPSSKPGVSSGLVPVPPHPGTFTNHGSHALPPTSTPPQNTASEAPRPAAHVTILLPYEETAYEESSGDPSQQSFEAALSGLPFRPSGLRMSRSKLAEMWNSD
ncbi:hypothetical protein KFL_002600070 [Klebsormidium nitens]|uniref:Letm1 RBD domain-containing protein n=1 Tax=Klebsormidium nitens TaxID=105231 RepID=A0A1Y1I912_KLENI|nr:hypothetical protein KFL_002600070 [Klebsormidium nitens]|eukprot:GAQ85899.1 hypothetical protein KFL_002600070 [Klebsormidium nitens]